MKTFKWFSEFSFSECPDLNPSPSSSFERPENRNATFEMLWVESSSMFNVPISTLTLKIATENGSIRVTLVLDTGWVPDAYWRTWTQGRIRKNGVQYQSVQPNSLHCRHFKVPRELSTWNLFPKHKVETVVGLRTRSLQETSFIRVNKNC